MTSIFGFGKVIASRLTTRVRNLVVDLVGNGVGDSAERCSGQEAWGHAAVCWKPLPDTELFFVRMGSDRVVIATRETRWQVDVKAGEVVLRALAEGGAAVRLTPDGGVHLESVRTTATRAIADGEAFEKFAIAYMNASPTAGDGGAAIQAAVKTAMTAVPLKSARHKMDG